MEGIMDGKEIVKIIDARLAELGMTQKEFCAQIGVQSSAMSAWRKGSMPNPQRIAAIEKCLGINFEDYEKSDPREELREDLATLLRSAEDLPPSSVYELIAEIHRRKEMGKVDSSD
jgi:transcriptional regulator with XRE-family HTH domain